MARSHRAVSWARQGLARLLNSAIDSGSSTTLDNADKMLRAADAAFGHAVSGLGGAAEQSI